jgi:GNAT superfamily N-acetyltransferase
MKPTINDISFRSATYDDVQFAAAVASAVDPGRPQGAEELLEKWANTDKVAEVRRFIVEETGVDRCWISLVQPGLVGVSTIFLNLLIPAGNEHLVPAAVVFGEAQAREMGASVLVCEVGAGEGVAVEWLRGGGWTQERRKRFWRLDLGAKADRIRELRSAAHKSLETTGVVIRTVADLGGEEYLRRLLSVRHEAATDIPKSVEYIPEPYEEWVVWMQPPAVLPERIWVAVVDGTPVGYSYLAYRPSGVETGFTGVLREHRGAGLARALKLQTLIQAIDLGVSAVETENDSENAPILRINEELGYEEIPGRLEFHRKLAR